MKPHEIYKKLEKRSISESHFFGRKLLTVSEADFNRYRHHFEETYNILNKAENYRTLQALKHIHAIKKGELVQFHYDYANLYVFLPMAIPHLFIDVIPYFLYFSIKKRMPYRVERDASI